MSSRTSNFPHGFANGITIRGMPLSVSHPGEVFFVNNSGVLPTGGIGGSDGNKGTYHEPWSTLEGAMNNGKVRASRGDVIFAMPGHAETISTATALNMDKAGVAWIGLGTGALRPTLTFDTATSAAISWTADYCSIQNFNLTGNFLSVAAAILNSGGAGMTVENCRFADTSAILGLLSCVTTTVDTNSDDFWFADNVRYSAATTTPGAALKILNTTRGVTVKRNKFWMAVAENNAAVILDHGALVLDEVLLEDNAVYSINTAQTTDGFLVKTSATTGSGILRNNLVRSQDPSAAIMVTAAAVQYGSFENYHTGETTQLSGFLLPAAGAD